MTLLKMSIYGAVIILAIIIIRAFTLHKLPKKTFLILWAVALVRLLVPFEISSGFSVYSLLPEVPEEFSLAETDEPFIPDPANPYEPFENYADYLKEHGNSQLPEDDTIIIGQDSAGAIYLPKDNLQADAIPLPDVETDAQYADDATASGTQTTSPSVAKQLQTIWQSAIPHLPVIWFTGVLLCAVFFLVSYIRCLREFRTSLPVTEEYAAEWLKQHPLKRTISIRQSDKISAPLTYRLFHPVILMPKKTDWNNLTQLDYVLYHEFTHIRRFDLLAKLVMIVALCLHWFNPLVWLMYFFFNRDLELSCDDCVVKHFNESKAAYANTLIGMEEKINYSTPLCNHFSKNAIEERIIAIMKSKKTTIGMMVAALVIIVIVVITLTTGRKEEDVTADITPTVTVTPTVTQSVTLTPVPTTEPTPAPGNEFYYPETNYTYSNKDSLAKFDYSGSTISPEDGYDFTISSFVSAAGKPLLANVTLNLEAYAGNTAWWCLAAFYDGADNNVYLEFVPAAGVEDAPSGILHVTIPLKNPDAYTVHPAGDFHAQKASAFWFSDICKIQDKIYFNNGSCDGSLWVYDISTGEMSDLTYVNEKMQELANELCADYGWDHDPAIWFNVGWHSYDGITTYEANVCKEMDLATFYIMRVHYKDGQFLDYSSSYKGAQEEPSTQEELNTQMQELFFRYQNMQEELFHTNLKVDSDISSDEWVTINGTGGYTKVLDERFPTLKSVFDYMETICTPQFAMYLRDKNWKLSTTEPVVAEHNGILYTQCYDGVMLGESYRFSPVVINEPNTCTLSYEAYIGIPSNKTESGTVTFWYTDGSWHVQNHTYTYYHDFVDGLDIQIMADLFSKYRTMWTELFNSNLECGYYSNPSPEEVTIHGIPGYYKVLDERFPTMQSLIDYMETIYTPELAVELRKKYYLSADSDYPLLTEMDGMLYTQVYHSSTNGYTQEFQFTDLQYNGSDTAIVNYQTGGTIYPNIVEVGTITFRVMERGGWRIAELDYGYKNIATEGIFEDTPASPPTTTGPDWYNAVSELMHGNTPKNTAEAEQSFHSNYGDLKSIQPSNENGHVFTISNLVLWEEKNVVLKDVSLDLSPYTTSFVWRENGIYYEEANGEVYVVFSPTLDEAKGGTGMVEYQVLLATIPQVGSGNYTIRCYGNPESPLVLGGYHTYSTTKIDNLIYLGESCHGDTFYTINIDTMELLSLRHVNDALYTQAESYLAQCGLGTEFALSSHVVCKTGDYTVFSADVSYSFDNSPTYFTVYHAYDGSELVGKVIFRHQIPFYDAINESHVNAMYISMDDVVTMAKEQFEKFCDSKNYNQPCEITSIHMTSFESMEVEFLISESDNFEVYTEGTVDFTYNFTSQTWSVSSFRETPPDYLTSFLEFQEIAAEEVVVTGKDWCLTFLDETELPRFQELMDAGGKLSTELTDSRFPEEGYQYTITLDGIGYYFYSDSAPEQNHQAWNVYILSPDYPLSGGAKVGMTVEELLTLYPELAKSSMDYDDPLFNAKYGPRMVAFRDDQFPESFLNKYDYAYTAYLNKGRDGLPVCIAFLIKNNRVGAITVYMPTAG